MKTSHMLLGSFFTLVGLSLAAAQPANVPASALAAEQDQRWLDAAQVYRTTLEGSPSRADLWLRLADVEARLGRTQEAIAALQKAAKARPSDASIHSHLSQAYATDGHADAALQAIDTAVTLEPRNAGYLEARATLATWAGRYSVAEDSYRRLSTQRPNDVDLLLAHARVSAWAGNTDESVGQYKQYLRATPQSAEGWLELAKTESWRGNYAGAKDALNQYRGRFGETPAYSQLLAQVWANADRPGRAEDLLSPLLARTPNSYDLALTQTLALAMQRRSREAFQSFDTVRRLAPNDRQTENTARVLRMLLDSALEPQVNAYSDSDRLQTLRATPHVTLALRSGTQLSGGYDRTWLEARPSSGLEQLNGKTSAQFEQGWAGASQKIGRVTFAAKAGYASAAGRDRTTNMVGLEARPTDSFRFSASRSFGLFVVSPRTVGLGLTQTAYQARADWTPGLRYTIVGDASYQLLSDGNRRVEVAVSPRRSIARLARLNLDLGALAYRLETERDLDHGYYDPARYEQYAATAYPYFKFTDNVGLGMTVAAGVQRDRTSKPLRFGGSATAEATFGIYAPWVLKVNGSTTINQRLESGAFTGYGAGIVLVRRF